MCLKLLHYSACQVLNIFVYNMFRYVSVYECLDKESGKKKRISFYVGVLHNLSVLLELRKF